jgi:hypothetical protein
MRMCTIIDNAFCYFYLRRTCLNMNEVCVCDNFQRSVFSYALLLLLLLLFLLILMMLIFLLFILACFDLELSYRGFLEAVLDRSDE